MGQQWLKLWERSSPGCLGLNNCLGHVHQFLDSLVVRISACHVEGPGSIPGRGENFFPINLRCKNAGKIGGASFLGPFKGRLSVQTLTFIVMGKR